jgi:hypothetical protein
MKTSLFLITIIITALSSVHADDVKVYDKNWNVKGQIKR